MRDEQDWRAPDMDEDGQALHEPAPPTITGLLEDYAGRPSSKTSSLSMFMNDQQMRDAGVHPEQMGASGTGDPKEDPAGGHARVIRDTRKAVSWGHGGASALGQAPTIAKGLVEGASALRQSPNSVGWKAARQIVKSAAAEAASHPVVAGINTLTRATVPPLFAAESVARGMQESRNGRADPDTIIGNIIRGTVVTGASLVSPAAAGVANAALPDGRTMGRAYHKSMVDTQGRALLLP